MYRIVCLLGLAALLASCKQADKSAEFEDTRNPQFQKAATHLEEKNYAEAVRDYEVALQINPNLAAAHYELGQLYADKVNDQVKAMYHLKMFLEMKPNSDKKDQAKSLMDKQRMAMNAVSPNTAADKNEALADQLKKNVTLSQEVETLRTKSAEAERELATVKGALAESQRMLAARAAAPPPTSVTMTSAGQPVATGDPSLVPPPAAGGTAPPMGAGDGTTAVSGPAGSAPGGMVIPPGARTHTIVSHDSLWSISKKYYKGDVMGGIQKIEDANKEALPKGKPLKLGTVLVIP